MCAVAQPPLESVRDTLLEHLLGLYDLYGEEQGLRVARKHLGWYVRQRPGGETFRQSINVVTSVAEQLRLTREYFDCLSEGSKGV